VLSVAVGLRNTKSFEEACAQLPVCVIQEQTGKSLKNNLGKRLTRQETVSAATPSELET
jgi:hypothetical protein